MPTAVPVLSFSCTPHPAPNLLGNGDFFDREKAGLPWGFPAFHPVFLHQICIALVLPFL